MPCMRTDSERTNRFSDDTPMMDVCTELDQHVAGRLRLVVSGLASPVRLSPRDPTIA